MLMWPATTRQSPETLCQTRVYRSIALIGDPSSTAAESIFTLTTDVTPKCITLRSTGSMRVIRNRPEPCRDKSSLFVTTVPSRLVNIRLSSSNRSSVENIRSQLGPPEFRLAAEYFVVSVHVFVLV